jgi:uroporphyrinogen-III synthase
MRLLVTRPEPDASREAEALAMRGHEAVVAPLLAIEFLDGAPLPLAGAQALIATSRNALRALASRRELGDAVKLPLFAVGEATEAAAKTLGFAQVMTGPGTAAALAKLIAERLAPERGALVHLAGETVAFDMKPELEMKGFELRRTVLYRGVPARELPAKALALLQSGGLDGAIILSPRTAKILAELLVRHSAVTQAQHLVCYCLSQGVADALAPLGSRLCVAARPREEDVLALLDSRAASS